MMSRVGWRLDGPRVWGGGGGCGGGGRGREYEHVHSLLDRGHHGLAPREGGLRSKDNLGSFDRHFLARLPQHAQHRSVRLTAPASADRIYRGWRPSGNYTVEV